MHNRPSVTAAANFYSNHEHTLFSHKNEDKSNEVSLSNLRFSQYNLGLVFHTIYSGIFRPCNSARIAFSTIAFSVTPIIFPLTVPFLLLRCHSVVNKDYHKLYSWTN